MAHYKFMTQILFPKPKTIKPTQYEKFKAKMLKDKEIRAKYLTLRRKKPTLRKKRVKLPSIRSLITKADKLFSVFVRNRDKKCVLCGKAINLTNGHLVKRGKKSVRWDEVNCNCLCMACNYRDNFDHDIYVSWFLREYGEAMYQDLVERSRGVFKPNREYLNGIISKYSI